MKHADRAFGVFFMKTSALVLLGAALLGAVSLRANDNYAVKEPFSQTHAFKPTGTLRLKNINGHIEIRAWDRNEILVEGEKSAATDEDLKRIDLEVKLSDDDAEIEVKLPKREGSWFGENDRAQVTFRISVPATAQLANIASVNSGITVEGMRGPVAAKSVNGGVTARGLAADAKLSSVNGSISATFTEIRAGQKLSFDSVNGGVTVQLPKDAGLSVRCSTMNGGIDCDLPITMERSSHHKLTGTIGDGRATLKASTLNGGVHIQAM